MSQSASLKDKRSSSAIEDSSFGVRHFDAAALGASFQQLAVDVVRGERTDFMSRWFKSVRNDADLVIWTDTEKRIIKHQLCFYGQVVEWNPINGTRTGLVIEEDVSFEMKVEGDGKKSVQKKPLVSGPHPETTVAPGTINTDDAEDSSETIRFDKITQVAVVEQALQLLAAVPDLAPEDRAALIFNLRESPKMHKKARERALHTWAPKVDEIVSTRRSTFWRRFKNWVLGD